MDKNMSQVPRHTPDARRNVGAIHELPLQRAASEVRGVFSNLQLVACSILLFLTACAPAPVKKVEIFWPLPPDPPRISYISSFSEPKDLGRTKSFFRKAIEFLFGEDTEPHIIRPYGVFSDGKGKVYVTDMGLQVVHVFDFAEKSYRQVFKLENGRLRTPIGVAIDS